jgi:hypothetical protein
MRMRATSFEEVKQRRRWSRRFLGGLGALLFVLVAVVYAGTFLEAHVAFPGCSRPLDPDGSTTQAGHSSTRWVPPTVRCSYPRDELFGVSADQEDHFAIFGVVIVGFFAAALMFGTVLATGGGLGEDASLER